MIDAATTLRATAGELNGDYNAACVTQVERFTAALDEVSMARQRVLESWNAYASSGVVPPKLQQQSTAADKLSLSFLDENVSGLRTACYTEADRA